MKDPQLMAELLQLHLPPKCAVAYEPLRDVYQILGPDLRPNHSLMRTVIVERRAETVMMYHRPARVMAYLARRALEIREPAS